jgi:hypothetical protein
MPKLQNILIPVGALVFSLSAQTINLTGKITNAGGKAISGAVVTLSSKNLKDTTDASGTFMLKNGTATIHTAAALPATGSVSLKNGMLTFSLQKPSAVCVELFDVHGSLLGRDTRSMVPAGTFQSAITRSPSASQMMLIRIAVGSRSVVFRYLPVGANTGTFVTMTGASPVFSTTAAVVDSLKVNATGYMPTTKTLSALEGQVNITLDTMSLAKFSFFVTSLAGLQALSGSEKGFGGDFRFGKTGQGAGLLGADSICQCLAERSMPGSKVKQWRAFLSAVKGPDGNQVNAIDRIGNGPWYDRLGRLLANQKSELTAGARPANADAAIKNDLPNEDGVPNHRPDPNKAQVDNHMFVTGSDSTGKLYYGSLNGNNSGWGRDTTGSGVKGNATCNDWTSITKDYKARCGLSWPQAMGGGMKNWISQMNTAGCEPGTDLTEASMGGTPGIYTIGNGGGYGGFYCFALNP